MNEREKNINISISSTVCVDVVDSFNDCRFQYLKENEHIYTISSELVLLLVEKKNCQLKINPKCLSFAKESFRAFACQPHMTLLTVIISYHCYATLQFVRIPMRVSINKNVYHFGRSVRKH